MKDSRLCAYKHLVKKCVLPKMQSYSMMSFPNITSRFQTLPCLTRSWLVTYHPAQPELSSAVTGLCPILWSWWLRRSHVIQCHGVVLTGWLISSCHLWISEFRSRLSSYLIFFLCILGLQDGPLWIFFIALTCFQWTEFRVLSLKVT